METDKYIRLALEALDKRLSVLEKLHADIPITHRYHRSDDEWQFYHEAANATEQEREQELQRIYAQFGKPNVRHNDDNH